MPSVVAKADGFRVTVGSVVEVTAGAHVTCAAIGAGRMVKVTDVEAEEYVDVAAEVALTTQVPAVDQVKTAVVALTEQFEVLVPATLYVMAPFPVVEANVEGVKVVTGRAVEVFVGSHATKAAVSAGLIVKVTEVLFDTKFAVVAVVAFTIQLPDVLQVNTAVVAFTAQFEVLPETTL